MRSLPLVALAALIVGCESPAPVTPAPAQPARAEATAPTAASSVPAAASAAEKTASSVASAPSASASAPAASASAPKSPSRAALEAQADEMQRAMLAALADGGAGVSGALNRSDVPPVDLSGAERGPDAGSRGGDKPPKGKK